MQLKCCVSLLLVYVLLLCPLVLWQDAAHGKVVPSSQPNQARRPNIILILADDLGWGDVSFNGRTEWRTPHIDRLAAQGTIFRRWYTAGVVCAPSRAALMTGKYTIHNGVSGNSADLPGEETTIAEALKPLGYTTGLFGKWHRGGRRRPGETSAVHPLDQGFDEFYGYIDAGKAWEKFPKELYAGRKLKPVSGHADTLFTDQAINFIKRHQDRPFFLYQAYVAPHLRIEAPAEDIAEHVGKFKERDPKRPLYATYAAQITRMDKEVGRLMKVLDQLRLADNTLVVFTSDHGATFEPLNEGTSAYLDSNKPFRGQKRTLWEGGIRVPAAVRFPGRVPAGKISSNIIGMIDVMPTFLAAAGGKLDPAWKVDGVNMLPALSGTERARERTLFWEWRDEGSFLLAAMRGDIKLVVTDRELLSGDSDLDPRLAKVVIRQPELYNVEIDPAERRSIVYEHQLLAKQLKKELTEWLATETVASKQGRGEEVSTLKQE